MPSSGAGSEYGKEWKEEMKRKRKGQFRKEVSKEDLLYSLKLCGGKKDKRYVFITKLFSTEKAYA